MSSPFTPTASRSSLKAAVSTWARMIFVPLRFAALCSAQLKYRKQQRIRICGILHQNHPSPALTSDQSLRQVGNRAALPPYACVEGDDRMFAREGRMYRNGQRNQFPLQSLTVSEAEQWVCDSETAVTEVLNKQLQMSEPKTQARQGSLRGLAVEPPRKKKGSIVL